MGSLAPKQLKMIENIISSQCMQQASRMLRKRLREAKENNFSDAEELNRLIVDADRAYAEYQARIASMPKFSYPEELPITAKADEIRKAVEKNQVVVIAGATGSGKTTQIPKICIDAGLGKRGFIGHTQPRRLAARTVASRIAEEMGVELGTAVGYKVRFGDRTDKSTVVKLMTDGILLAELARDKYLNDYEAIIIDEAHERSLNIDFLLGYLKILLKKRRDLKLIITSATIDVKRFSEHFGNAPIIEVSGRTYPVETVYMPDDEDGQDALLKAIDYLSGKGNGDILVFLDGERTIFETADLLNRQNYRHTDVLPLYARLSNQDQNKIFLPHSHRHIVLATNVAETSLTVPGITYVIDAGMARISRYSPRTKVQRLPVEPISRSSAEQRKGRCGRTCPGICVRLYSEEDFLSRPEFTDPEILRTNLASVILQMISFRLGNIEDFPFIDRPDKRQIADGYKLLHEIKAIEDHKDGGYSITEDGRKIAAIPVDPRLARILVTASKEGSLSEAITIVSDLSIQDPRERPLNKREMADESHKRFSDEKSDFTAILKLWDYVSGIAERESISKLRRACSKEFLSFVRIREWMDLRRQIASACEDLELRFNEQPAKYPELHRALLSGLLGNIGWKTLEGPEYLGASGIKFLISNGSGLNKSKKTWVMAAELTETSKVFAQIAAVVNVEWIEEFGKHLLRKTYSNERWSKKQGAVVADMKITLYGLTLEAARTATYTKINPKLCRELFIRSALVEGDFDCDLPFYRHNCALIDEVLDEEDRARRRDILISDSELFDFYDAKLPDDVNTAAALNSWWKKQSKTDPHYLDFTKDQLISDSSKLVNEEDYPSSMNAGRYTLPLSYNFSPLDENDGVTATVPLQLLNQITSKTFDFIVPGLRREFFIEALRTLPKRLRKLFIPVPTYADALMQAIDANTKNLWQDITAQLTRMGGTIISKEDFDLSAMPRHLSYYFRVVDAKGKTVATGRDIDALKRDLKEHVREELGSAVASLQKTEEIKSLKWEFGKIETVKHVRRHGLEAVMYPALCDLGDGVTVKNFESEILQERSHRDALVRLLENASKPTISAVQKSLGNGAKLAVSSKSGLSGKDVLDDACKAAIASVVDEFAPKMAVTDKGGYDALEAKVRSELSDRVKKSFQWAEKIFADVNYIVSKIKGNMDMRSALCFADANESLKNLLHKGFIYEFGYHRLPDIHRYMQALKIRTDKIAQDPMRDQMYARNIAELKEEWDKLVGNFGSWDETPDEVRDIRWLFEELRVSYFAQQLGTKQTVSDKRIAKEIARVAQLYS